MGYATFVRPGPGMWTYTKLGNSYEEYSTFVLLWRDTRPYGMSIQSWTTLVRCWQTIWKTCPWNRLPYLWSCLETESTCWHIFSISNMFITEEECMFIFSHVEKNTCPGFNAQSMTFSAYPFCDTLCPVKTIWKYVQLRNSVTTTRNSSWLQRRKMVCTEGQPQTLKPDG